jgi:hypothetical protein
MVRNISENDSVRVVLNSPEDDVDGEYHGEIGTVLTVIEDDLDTGNPEDRQNARVDPDRDDLEPRWFRGSELKRMGSK